VDQPFEVWWSQYKEGVRKSVVDTEQHLGVPAGTISSIQTEPDFVAMVKTYAVIEPILNQTITKRLPRAAQGAAQEESCQAFVSAQRMGRGPNSKLRLAKGLGLLTTTQIHFIEAVTDIRNRYAHDVGNMPRPLKEIVIKEQKNHGNILVHLTGIKVTLAEVHNDNIKLFMYFRLADYLSDALHTLRPPPAPPEGGLLGLGSVFPPTVVESHRDTSGTLPML
jgi:hypothetical protein